LHTLITPKRVRSAYPDAEPLFLVRVPKAACTATTIAAAIGSAEPKSVLIASNNRATSSRLNFQNELFGFWLNKSPFDLKDELEGETIAGVQATMAVQRLGTLM
jgi:hypothetical protein